MKPTLKACTIAVRTLPKFLLMTVLTVICGQALASSQKKVITDDKLMKYVFDPARFNIDFSDYDAKTAMILAQLSDLSYEKEPTIKRTIEIINRKFGSHLKYKFYEDTHDGIFNSKIHLLVVADEAKVICAFRGTKKLGDWIADLKQKTYENNPKMESTYMGLPLAPGGFRAGVMALLENHRLDSLDKFIDEELKVEIPLKLTTSFRNILTT